MTTNITVDYERNCEKFWDNARAEAKGNPPASCVGLLDSVTTLTVSDEDAAEFIAWAESIDGYGESPFVISTEPNNRNRFITISTDETYWGDTTADQDFNVADEVAKIRDAAESQGIEVLTDEQPRIVCSADGKEKHQVDWFTTWCREGYLWTNSQWREWFAN